MTRSGLEIFDTTVQKTHIWINDLAAQLGWEDKHKAFQGLRATLHALRDRLTADEAAHLGAELPILLAGFYYEGWKPTTNPSKERSQEDFLARIRDRFQNIDPNVDVEQLARAVFKLLAEKISQAEIKDVTHILPSSLKQLWPEGVRA